jgi:hypothetical protein
MAPVADSRVGARARRVAPMMSARRCPLVGCAAQAQDCAVAQPCAPADAPREEPGALRSTGTLPGGGRQVGHSGL